MSCYHPLILINTSNMQDPLQRKIVENLKLVHKHNEKIRSVNTIIIPRELAEKEGLKLRENKAITIPCGRCIGCRLDYSRQWAERCVHEASTHDYNYFVTLTYDDEHLPIGSKGFPTLVKDEISKFMKSLRQAFKLKLGIDGIRFFGAAEYGERSLRPHLHIILFNCNIPDLQERHPIMVDGKLKWIRQFDSSGEMLMYSPLVDSAWKKGTCQIGQVTYESCAYVARYIVKKQYGDDAKQYSDAGVIPPYVRMSLKPGIGYEWYKENLDRIYVYDSIPFKRGDLVINTSPGRYCDKILQKEDEQLFYDIKHQRTSAFYDSIDVKGYEAIDLAFNNKKAEEEKLSKIKVLKRCL